MVEMARKRLLVTGFFSALLVVAGALFYAWHPAIPPIDPPAGSTFDQATISNGRTLALIGDCQTCHTAPGGRVFAGARAMPTPFGTIYSTNITPEPETGIGRWSEAAFVRAMRRGIDREGRHLYPAFPYDHFGLTTEDDLKALYAFFMTRDPVRSTAPANQLPFPINVRLVLAGWKLLFLRDRRLKPEQAGDPVWNRGKYLAEGVGHCGACHTPRNLMGAEESSRAFQGGEAEGWHAYALGPESKSPVPWDEPALIQYLEKGFHPLHGVARGPMAPVVDNLALVPPEDVAAIARYIVAPSNGSARAAKPNIGGQILQPNGPGTAPQSAGVQAATPATSGDAGSRIYAASCASCHESGRNLPLGGINLALSTAIRGESAENLVNIVLNGLPAEDGTVQPVMPGFSAVLTDQQLQDLVGYLRDSIARSPVWPDLGAVVSAARAAQNSARRRQSNRDGAMQ
jgi:mono/diheme cytochrome c family protein